MLRIGLTGSIATGKSTVLGMIRALDIPTISSDEVVHRLYEGAAVAPIEQLFPGVTTSGRVDRTELSRRLVAEPHRLRELEAAVHPLVRAEIASFFTDAEARGAPLAVADIPLLYEGGFDYALDAVIVTTVDAAIQRDRALQRPGMDEAKLAAILARQLPQADKLARADYVIDTSGTFAATREAVKALIGKLQANRLP
jgi:dephospho-CoA kinase